MVTPRYCELLKLVAAATRLQHSGAKNFMIPTLNFKVLGFRQIFFVLSTFIQKSEEYRLKFLRFEMQLQKYLGPIVHCGTHSELLLSHNQPCQMSFFPTSTGSKLHLIKAAQCTLGSLALQGLSKVQYPPNYINSMGYSSLDRFLAKRDQV